MKFISIILLIILLFSSFSSVEGQYEIKIPDWIKNNAKWWSEGLIGDPDFVSGIQYMIQNDIIKIPNLPEQASKTAEEKIPDWIKNNAKWWSEGLIGDSDFVSGIRYLIQKGILTIYDSNPTVEIPNDFKIFSNLKDIVEFQNDEVIFNGAAPRDYLNNISEGKATHGKLILLKKQQLSELYKKLQYDENLERKTVIVMPTLTSLAYSEPGFYTYYRDECDTSCLIIPLRYLPFLDFKSNVFAVQVFDLLGYERISDIEIDVNPDILNNYDKVVLLHSEYVTQKMFDAIINHPNVIYLYPNALYAEIEINYDENSIKLIRGHNYPEQSIANGFDWEYDNTHPYEYDEECKDWEFYRIDNGYMLNCYPENLIITKTGIDLLMKLKEF